MEDAPQCVTCRMKDPTPLPPPSPDLEVHHRVTVDLMGKKYAIDFTATAQEVKGEVVEIRPPSPPRLVLVEPPQKPSD
jgi:hypothetical protein